MLAKRAEQDFPQASLVIELGRYLVGEAGIYVTRSSTARCRVARFFWWSMAD
jgi:diaminopimelate decarboxylase